MRIMHLTDQFVIGGGGVANYIQEIVDLLGTRGHTSVVCCDPLPGRQARPGEAEPLELDVGPAARALSLQRHLDAFHPDVVMVHQVTDAELVRLAQTYGPTIGVVHGPYVTCPSLGRFFTRGDAICDMPMSPRCLCLMYSRRCSSVHSPLTALRLYRSADQLLKTYRSLGAIVAVSNYIKHNLVQNGFLADRIHVLYPQFGQSEHVPQVRERTLIVYAGRIERTKGLDYLIAAMTRVSPQLRLVLAGDGSYLAALRRMVQTKQLDNRVTFLGQIAPAEVAMLIGRALVVVVPSIWPEPFGKVGVEALDAGTPVIASRVGGLSEWLEHERYGLLVEPADAEGLARAIQKLADNPEQAEAWGRNGREMVLRSYRPEAHADALEALLNTRTAQWSRRASGIGNE